MMVSCGIPQGSMLGPIFFLLYTADVVRIVETHSLHPHLYSDDPQIYGFCSPGYTVELQSRVSACIDDVSQWMKSNRLQLNATKTKVIWCSSTRRQHQIPTAHSLSDQMQCIQCSLSKIWVCTWTRTSRCAHEYSGPCQAASLWCDKYEASDGPWQDQYFCH